MGKRRSPRRHTVHTKHPRYSVEKYGRGRTAPYAVAFPSGTKYIYPHATRRPNSSKYELFYSKPIETDSSLDAIRRDEDFGAQFNSAVRQTTTSAVPVKIRFNPETAEWEIWKERTIHNKKFRFTFERDVEGKRPMRIVSDGNTIEEARRLLKGWSIYDPSEFKVVERREFASPYTRKFGKKLGIGDRVMVSQGSGLDSGRTGTVISPSKVNTDGQGIPTNVPGVYKPVDWKREVAVRLDNGSLVTMYKNRLQRLN